MLRDLVSAGLNDLLVTQYDGKVHKHILRILEDASEQEKKVLHVRLAPKFIGNRGGTLNNTIITEPLLADCYLPSHQIFINYIGDVLICCNDYYGKVVVGKIGQNSLMDIWNGHEFRKIRRLLKSKRRDQIELCKGCNDTGDIYNNRLLTSDKVIKFNSKVRNRNTKLGC